MKLRKLFLLGILIFTCNLNSAQSVYAKAKAYCAKEKLNIDYCFLVDFSKHSGKHRFYIYDFKHHKIIDSSLCCHGFGGGSKEDTIVYSNAPGSNCSSIGKYKIGKRAKSNWGIKVHYKMHGLEKTNSNAFKRLIVLHSYDYVRAYAIYPSHLTLGWSMGCPVISNKTMFKADSLLKKSKLPTLLWIYK